LTAATRQLQVLHHYETPGATGGTSHRENLGDANALGVCTKQHQQQLSKSAVAAAAAAAMSTVVTGLDNSRNNSSNGSSNNGSSNYFLDLLRTFNKPKRTKHT
jgi:hypothetical protein